MEPVTFRISEENYIALSALHFRRTFPKFALVMGAICLGLVVLSITLAESASGMRPILVGVVIGLLIVWPLCRFVLIPRQAKKAYLEYKLIQEDMTLELGPETLVFTQASGAVKMPWRNFIKWDEDEAIMAIFPTGMIGYILPKNQIGEAHIDYARERLVESGLTTKGKRRK